MSYISCGSRIFNIEHELGDFVYVKTDRNQDRAQITGYQFRGGSIVYLVSKIGTEICFYDYELTAEQDDIMRMENAGRDYD